MYYFMQKNVEPTKVLELTTNPGTNLKTTKKSDLSTRNVLLVSLAAKYGEQTDFLAIRGAASARTAGKQRG